MQRNIGTESESLYTSIDLLIRQNIDNTRVATIGYITKHNNKTEGNYIENTVNVQPIIAEQINTQYNGKEFRILPELYNVPVAVNSKLLEDFAGKYCVLIYLDKNIYGKAQYMNIETSVGTKNIPIITGKSKSHGLSNCIVISVFDNLPLNI